MTNYLGFIGTYTKGESEGIYRFTLNTKEEKIENIELAAKIENPTYLAISDNNQYLYSIAKDGETGGVASFSLNSSNGELQLLNRQMKEGPNPCHVNVDSKNQYILATNYHEGTIEAYTIHPEHGTVNEEQSLIQHKGEKEEQKPHTHYAAFTPDEKFIAVVDLGIDQLLTYQLKDNQLVKVSQLHLKSGSGPRHLAFHPNGQYAYIMTEYSSEVIVLQYKTEDGTFTELQSISTIPEDFKENNQGSAIHVTSDGRFIYAGNRGHNSIAVFSIDPSTFTLTFVDRISSEGDWPRDFALDPSETFLIGSNQESSNLVLYKRDIETGKLTLLKSDYKVPYPICIKFIKKV